jgi:hypothetical protein
VNKGWEGLTVHKGWEGGTVSMALRLDDGSATRLGDRYGSGRVGDAG